MSEGGAGQLAPFTYMDPMQHLEQTLVDLNEAVTRADRFNRWFARWSLFFGFINASTILSGTAGVISMVAAIFFEASPITLWVFTSSTTVLFLVTAVTRSYMLSVISKEEAYYRERNRAFN